MTFSMTWLPQVLRSAGLKVIETPGWQTRGHGDMGDVLGVLCHHTNGARSGNMPTLNVLVEGRPDLAGPLSQLGLGRDGTYYIVCAGKGWHAGAGAWQGIRDGNGHMIGIEAENVGDASDPWPEVQMDAYKRGVAAILKYVGAQPSMCAGHKEYALPAGRKDDPNFDMKKFRADVAAIMTTSAPAPAPAPAPVPVPPAPAPKRMTGITATVFGGAADPNTSAYDSHKIGDTELGAALPFHFPKPIPRVRVYANGKSVDCALVDVGPWNTNDPYWEKGARPQAESGTSLKGLKTNRAGIDLTPAAARAIGIPGKGIVDWEFISTTTKETTMATPTVTATAVQTAPAAAAPASDPIPGIIRYIDVFKNFFLPGIAQIIPAQYRPIANAAPVVLEEILQGVEDVKNKTGGDRIQSIFTRLENLISHGKQITTVVSGAQPVQATPAAPIATGSGTSGEGMPNSQ